MSDQFAALLLIRLASLAGGRLLFAPCTIILALDFLSRPVSVPLLLHVHPFPLLFPSFRAFHALLCSSLTLLFPPHLSPLPRLHSVPWRITAEYFGVAGGAGTTSLWRSHGRAGLTTRKLHSELVLQKGKCSAPMWQISPC